jgi:hypothetical protein
VSSVLHITNNPCIVSGVINLNNRPGLFGVFNSTNSRGYVSALVNPIDIAGVGIGMAIVSGVVCIYYNVLIAWAIYFLFMSIRSVLPWSTCGNDWNTENCYLQDDNKTSSTKLLLNISDKLSRPCVCFSESYKLSKPFVYLSESEKISTSCVCFSESSKLSKSCVCFSESDKL